MQSSRDLFGITSPQEGEDDLEPIDPKTFASAVVASTDWTTETVLNQLQRGNIELDPAFQRRDAWKRERKSRFIESLILGLPVPQIVLAERKEHRGAYIVIDGKQRLLTLRQFAAGSKVTSEDDDDGPVDFEPLVLQGLKLRPDLNGLRLADIEGRANLSDDLKAFQNQTVRTVVVKAWPNETFLYTVFLRLNTGSVPLSPQELRQALHPGPFVNFADEFSLTSKLLHRSLNIKKADFRMRDVEIVVRYYAFKNFLTKYSGNLKTFLDETTRLLNKGWDARKQDVEKQANDLENAIVTTVRVFGDRNAFKLWKSTRYENRFNRAVFDVMSFYFSEIGVAIEAIKQAPALEEEFKRLCTEDDIFRQSLEVTTKSISATFQRLNRWGNSLSRILNLKLRVPQLENNRIVI